MRRAIILIISLLALLGLTSVVLSEPLPQGETGPAAETLAKAVQDSVNLDDWAKTNAVTWVFRGKNTHLWDRERGLAQVEWGGDTRVLVDLGKKQGRAFVDGQEITGEKKDKLVERAYASWINDSFWLNPIAKFYDDGVTRTKVDWEGKDALLITYSSGGITPGDSYLWILDENNRPVQWKMWVSIIPIKGISTSWEEWVTLDSGAQISTLHKMPAFSLDIGNVKGAASLEALVGNEDPFLPLFENSDTVKTETK